ncbi:MAG: FHA domain-containing protein [Dolichospermum sp. DEX189]|nr:FHA domain-containing protein [Dolichospermum sp. DEX189]
MNQVNLNQCLSALSQFTYARSNQNPIFSEVAQAVQQIGNNLNQQNKLKVKIFSQFTILAQAFSNFLTLSQSLAPFYDFNIVELPNSFVTIPQNQSLNSTLILKADPETGQPEYTQELNSNKSILIGRNRQKLQQDYRSQNGIILDLPNYKKVSSIHAEISLKPYSNPPTWQITDLNSKNGTFINDKKLTAHKF